MAKVKGLTIKQQATINDAVNDVERGKSLDLTKSVKKIYNTKSKRNASIIANANMKRDYFRDALLAALSEKAIIGADSKVERVLEEGLDAVSKGEVDHATRLAFAKEINKITGIYAPERRETKSMHMNMELPAEEVERRIKELKKELRE